MSNIDASVSFNISAGYCYILLYLNILSLFICINNVYRVGHTKRENNFPLIILHVLFTKPLISLLPLLTNFLNIGHLFKL